MRKWSKVRSEIEAKLALSIRGRVRLFITKYRKPTNDEEGRWAIYLDKEEAIGMGCIPADIEDSQLQHEHDDYDSASKELCARGHHTVYHFQNSLEQYLSMSVESALSSSDVVHRCLALLDRRVGKRRLSKYVLGQHAADELFYRFRLAAEEEKNA